MEEFTSKNRTDERFNPEKKSEKPQFQSSDSEKNARVPSAKILAETPVLDETGKTFFSSWGVSLFFHAILLLILTFTISQAVQEPSKGITEEEIAEAGIAFKTISSEKTLYESIDGFAEESSAQNNSAAIQKDTSLKTDSEIIAALSSEIRNMDTPDIPSISLQSPGLAPSTGSGSSGLDRITDGLGDITGIGSGTFSGFGKGTVSCFGTTGKGNTFIFVFDRSASMGFHPSDSLETPMKAAKMELRRSLRMLQSNQQFQIIFYCGDEADFLQYEAKKMLFATKMNVGGAERFLNSIVPFGGTDHRTALLMALAQHPDVIFFLTDADENETTLNAADLDRIRKNSAGTQINAIQFGHGPKPNSGNWLSRLAEQNGGQYVYLNIEQLK